MMYGSERHNAAIRVRFPKSLMRRIEKFAIGAQRDKSNAVCFLVDLALRDGVPLVSSPREKKDTEFRVRLPETLWSRLKMFAEKERRDRSNAICFLTDCSLNKLDQESAPAPAAALPSSGSVRARRSRSG